MRSRMWQKGLSALAIVACLADLGSAQVGIRLSVGGGSRGGSNSSRGGFSVGRMQSQNGPSVGRQRLPGNSQSGGAATTHRLGSGYGGSFVPPSVQRRMPGGSGHQTNQPTWTQNVPGISSRLPGVAGSGRTMTSDESLRNQVIQSVQPRNGQPSLKSAVAQELIQKATGNVAPALGVNGTKQNGNLGRKLISEAIQDLGIGGNGIHPQPGHGPHDGGGLNHGSPADPHSHHHGHHHPWFVIHWVPTFFAPPVQQCPAPPVVVCPPPAPICPPPSEVVIVETPVGSEPTAPSTSDASPASTSDSVASDTAETGATDDAKPNDELATSDDATDKNSDEGPKEPQSKEIDLQVEYVQLVDSGSAENQQGPLYRIWIVNHGTAPVVQPFDVVLVASNEEAPASDAPYAAQRVAKIESGSRLSVEIRLPVEVMQMGADAEGLPVPFKNLFAAVDIQQELAELNEQNNALGLARKDVPDAAMLASNK